MKAMRLIWRDLDPRSLWSFAFPRKCKAEKTVPWRWACLRVVFFGKAILSSIGLRLFQGLWVEGLVYPIRIPCTILCDVILCLIFFLSSARSLVNKTEKRTSDSMPLCIIGWMFQWRTHRTNLLFLSRHVFHLYLKLTIDMSWSSFDYPFFCRDLSIQWINQASPMSCSFGIEHHCIETYIYIVYSHMTWELFRHNNSKSCRPSWRSLGDIPAK